MPGSKQELLTAPIVGYCPHIVVNPPTAVAFGRMWQGKGAAELCEECFWQARQAAVLMARQGHPRWSTQTAREFVDAHSVHE